MIKECICYGLTTSRERGSFQILPTDGAGACKPISLDRRHLDLVRDEWEMVDHGNMRETVVTFGNQEYVPKWYCKLQVGKHMVMLLIYVKLTRLNGLLYTTCVLHY